MPISIDMPQAAEDLLRIAWGDLEMAARDALLIESYRTGRISIGYLGEVLGLGAVEAEAWLAHRGVALNYRSSDLEADRRTHARLFNNDPPA